MKKALALILCLVMLLTLAVGCKKKEEEQKVAELTDSLIASDLINSDNLYYFAHTGDITSMAELKVEDKKQDGNTLTLTASATAGSECIEVELTAKMKYTVQNGAWKLASVEITKAVPTVIAAPTKESVLSEIENYLAYNLTSREQEKSIALGIKGEERYELEINPRNVAWNMEYEDGSTTAKLTAALNNNDVAFIGYYSLSFDNEQGWVIASEKQENGQGYLVLYLETIELKKTAVDEK